MFFNRPRGAERRSRDREMKRRGAARRALIAAAAAVAVAGCDTLTSWSQKLGLSDDDSRPVGIGTKTDEFRRSPCSCLEIELEPAYDGYRARLRARLRV